MRTDPDPTLSLIAGISDDDLERVHTPLLSPLVWDVGHIAAFEDLWLAHRAGGLPLLRPDLADVYDAFETPRAGRGGLPYLRRADAETYLREVRTRTAELPPSPFDQLVRRHELQHHETMLQTMAIARIERPVREPPAASGPAPSGLDLVAVAAGPFPLGAEAHGFAYDNERPQHTVDVAAFSIGKVAVTNGDWLEWVADGGYERRELWSDAGWRWRCEEQITAPMGWLGENMEWRFGDGAVPIDPARPVVHVSWHEATAFAKARDARLPTESEWEKAAVWDGERKWRWPWGVAGPDAQRANLIESGRLAPAPASRLSASPCGALGMIGDVWEWTASTFTGYPGFAAHPYREYSEVFFGEQHRVLRGGSFAASGQVCTATFRNWDYPVRRQLFAGLRVAR
ncbi:MAG: ergothioneine biosynthesis protein EgtB [Solirubrobacteraceae bacterium]